MNKAQKKQARHNRRVKRKSEIGRRSAAPVTIENDTEIYTRDLTVRSFHPKLDTLDEEKRTFDAVIATDSRVLVFDMMTFEVVEEILLMDGLRTPPPHIPLLDSHMRFSVDEVLGNASEFVVDGGELNSKIFFEDDSDKADRTFRKYKSRSLTDFSIGYSIHNSVMIPAGQEAEVRGILYKATPERGLRITVDWSIFETSATTIGADPLAKARNSLKSPKVGNSKEKEKEMGFNAWLEKRGLIAADLSEKAIEALKADFNAEMSRSAPPAKDPVPTPAPAPDPVPIKIKDGARSLTEAELEAERSAAVDAEMERQDGVRSISKGLNLDPESLRTAVDEMVKDKTFTVERAQSKFLEMVRDRPEPVGMPAVHVHDSSASVEALSDGQAMRGGIIPEDEKRAEAGDKYRNMSLKELAHECAAIDGQPMKRYESWENICLRVFSGGSFANITSNVATKAMMVGFNATTSNAMNIFRKGNLNDFKVSSRIRLSDASGLEKVNSAGEVTHQEMEDIKEDIQLDTFAKQFSITRQDMIDDDIGALTLIPRRMGSAAVRKIDDIAFAILLDNANLQDGVALFLAATHSNLETGATSAMDATNAVEATRAAVQAMAKQQDINKTPLNIKGSILLVTPEDEFVANQVFGSANLLVATGNTTTRENTLTANPFGGQFRVISEPRLSDTDFNSNASTTAWYLLADPMANDTVEVAFLNGNAMPTLTRFGMETNPNMLGITWQVFLDIGAKALDFRAMVKNDGV